MDLVAEDLRKIRELQKRVKELEAENERLKAERNCAIMSRDMAWDENERLKAELQQSATSCNKLKCLALHAMQEYCFAQGTIIHTKLEFAEQSIEEDRKMIHKVNIRDRWGEYFAEAYRNAKKELKEGK